MDVGGGLREILGNPAIDRRDRRREADALRRQRQRHALRHVAEDARHVDAEEAAPLNLAR
jgi:hypothetical protein